LFFPTFSFADSGLLERQAFESIPPAAAGETNMNKKTKQTKGRRVTRQKFPRGWDERRVRKVLAHYENQTEDEALAEDEAAYRAHGQTVMIVPTDLVPAVRQLIARRRGA
jgi:hypothetical protein